jgi:1,4-dihydroxy-2-naphthoyl-CoA synthase
MAQSKTRFVSTAGLALEREAIAHVFASDDATEGIVAFGDKRTPAFQGR